MSSRDNFICSKGLPTDSGSSSVQEAEEGLCLTSGEVEFMVTS